jgi:ketosteroid isomerase-like protein
MTTDLRTPSPKLDPNRPHALNDFWRDAFNAGDLAALMSTYEDGAIIVPGPGADPLHGHDAIADALSSFLALGGTLRYTPRHWLVQDDIAFSSIAFTLDGGTSADGNRVDLHGITTEVLRRQADGTWKYVIDHPFGGSD